MFQRRLDGLSGRSGRAAPRLRGGNLDPCLLTTTPEVVAAEARAILESMRGRPGHIFNLGHGVSPAARLECIEALAQTVRSFA